MTKYKGNTLAKGSQALELHNLWLKVDGKEKQEAMIKLDKHMKELEQKYKELTYGSK